jgi:outer membrane protein assembly factor BamB
MLTLGILASACSEDPVSFPPSVSTSGYELVWRDSLFSAVTRPVADDSNVYFLDELHVVTAVNKRSGQLRWRTKFMYDVEPGFRSGAGMAIAGGRLIVGDVDVFGLDRGSGAVAWRVPLGLSSSEQAGHSRLTTDGATIYTGSITGRVYALDAASGAERWRSQVTASTFLINDPVLADGVLYLTLAMRTEPYDGGVAAVRATDGQRLWLTRFPAHPGTYGVATGVGVSDASLFASAKDDVVVLDRASGATRLIIPGATFRPPGIMAPFSGFDLSIAGNRQIVIVASTIGTVVGLDGSDGHVRWKTHASSLALDMDVIGDRVYIAGGAALDALRINDGSFAWSALSVNFPVLASYDFFRTAPAVDDDRVYLGSDHGLYAYRKR